MLLTRILARRARGVACHSQQLQQQLRGVPQLPGGQSSGVCCQAAARGYTTDTSGGPGMSVHQGQRSGTAPGDVLVALRVVCGCRGAFVWAWAIETFCPL